MGRWNALLRRALLKALAGTPAQRLRFAASLTTDVLASTGYQHDLVVRPGGDVFVRLDGILLSTEATNRYYKVAPGQTANQGRTIEDVLALRGIEPRTVVDLGANFGEISLYLGRAYPNAHILAVEASSTNAAVFEKNMAIQCPPITNVKLAVTAIADYEGTAYITSRLHSENQLVSENSGHAVPCTTMTGLLHSHAIETVDFLKIDIEGSEPLLTDDLITLAPRIRSLLVEFSRKNSRAAYDRLLVALALNYDVVSMGGDHLDLDKARHVVHESLADGHTLDLWFLRRED